MQDHDSIVFKEEYDTPSTQPPSGHEARPWKIMVIDDDHDVHTMTHMVLRDYLFEKRPVTFLFGVSGEDAKRLMADHPDTAILLLDVVMEREQAGLEAVQFIRKTLNNRFVRIILRTGQPGRAPEQTVITTYDINDYKEKTELTAQKLITVVTASLRAYRDLRIIEENRRGLEKIIRSTHTLFEPQSLKKLAMGVLIQLVSLLDLNEGTLYIQPSGFAAVDKDNQLTLYAGTGVYEGMSGKTVQEVAQQETVALVEKALAAEKSLYQGTTYVGYFRTKNGTINLLLLQGNKPLNAVDQTLIDIFSTNVALAFDNVYSNQAMQDSQRRLAFSLGAIADSHADWAENHLRRVADSARLLAQKAGLPEEEVEQLWLSAPLHDLGKIAIPDAVITKPGQLTPEEWAVMQSHTNIGARLLRNAHQDILHSGANIAEMHHEQWNGLGYPKGLTGEEIPLFSRITSLVDVFDTLSHDRYYSKAWETERILTFIQSERGKRFDPRLVDLFLENLSEFQAIQMALPDAKDASNNQGRTTT